MAEDNPKPVDVMSLDKDSELAARLHADPEPSNEKVPTKLGRGKNISPKRRSKKSSVSGTVEVGMAKLLNFENLIPFELNFTEMAEDERDRFYDHLYDGGCKMYFLLEHITRDSVSPQAVPAAKSTFNMFVKSIGGFLTGDDAKARTYPQLDEFMDVIEKKKIDDYQVFTQMRELLAGGFFKEVFVHSDDTTVQQLPPLLAAEALSVMAKVAIRSRAARAVETMMAVPNSENGEEGGCDDESATEALSYTYRQFCSFHQSFQVEPVTVQQNALLELACKFGFNEFIDILVEINKTEFDGDYAETTALMEAISSNQESIALRLIELGSDVSAKSKISNNTPLIYAAALGQIEVVKSMLATGRCSLSANNGNGHDALMEAANMNQLEMVKILFEAGAKSKFLNLNSEFKESAMTLGCFKGNYDVVKYILEEYEKTPLTTDAEKLERAEEMYTGLMEACMDGYLNVAQLLLEKGASVDTNADAFESPLTLAACGGYNDLCTLLLDAGANIEERNDENYTPLMEAAREGHIKTVELLLKRGALVNVPLEDGGDTPLSVAACGGYVEIMETLVDAGGDLSLGVTPPIVEASQEGLIEVVQFILAQCKNLPNEQLSRALVYAANSGSKRIVEELLKAGGDVNYIYDGNTALMKAAKNDFLEIVAVLVTCGANVNLTDDKNLNTALSLACSEGNTEIVQYLLRHGADPLIELDEGHTCIFEASRNGNADLMGMLIEFTKTGSVPKTADGTKSIPKTSKTPPKFFKKSSRKNGFMMNEMMSCFQGHYGAGKGKLGKYPNFQDSAFVSLEIEMLTHMLKLQQQMVSYEHHSLNEDKTTNVDTVLTVLKEIYGEKEDKTITFPPVPNRAEMDRMYIGEMVPTIRQWSELVAHGWVEMEKTVGHTIEMRAFVTTDSSKGDPAGKNSISENAISSAQQDSKADSTNKTACGHINTPSSIQESTFRTMVAKMDALFQERGGAALNARDMKTHFPWPEDSKFTRTSNAMKANYALGNTAANRNTINKKGSLASKTYPGIIRLAVEMENRYQTNKTEENKEMAVLTAYIASTVRNPEGNSDQPTGENLLKKLLSGLKTSEIKETMRRAKNMVNSEAGNQKLREEYLKLFRDTSDGTFYDECMKDKKSLLKQDAKKRQMSSSGTCSPSQPVTGGVNKATNKAANGAALRRTQSEGDQAERSKKNNPIDKATDQTMETPLTIACSNGHKEIVEMLIAEGANTEHRDKKGFTPIVIAATAGHASIVDLLINKNVNIEAQTDRTKDTALSLACSGGKKEVVELLLTAGANREHRNVSDYTPLSLAASGGYTEVVNMLLNSGSEINSRTGSKLGISPLMLAAMNGHKDATRVLLEKGSDINAQIETNRNTALTLASFQGRTEVVRLLLQYNANVEHRAKTGLTPLMEAANGGYNDVGALLLNSGADPNASSVPASKDTALTIAADKGHSKFVELLLGSGANLDIRNKKGCSPLFLAANSGFLCTVEVLLKAGADADASDNRKTTPLMAAFKKGHSEIVRLMVNYAKQFPSDQDLQRAIQSAETEEIKQSCQDCLSIIKTAKNEQAENANRAADDLLALLEQEQIDMKSKKVKQQEKKKKKKDAKKSKQGAERKDDADEETSRNAAAGDAEDVDGDDGEDAAEATLEVIEPVEETVEVEEVVPEPVKEVVKEPVKEVVKENQKKSNNKKKNNQQQQQSVATAGKEKEKPIPPEMEYRPIVVTIPPPAPTEAMAVSPSLSTSNEEWKKANGKKAKQPKRPTAVSAQHHSSTAPHTKESSTTSSVTSDIGAVHEIETNRRKNFTLSVGPIAISRVIGRGGTNINAVREATGAIIEIDKQSAKKDQERQVNVRGTPEAVKSAVQIIQLLISDGDIVINDAIRSVLRGNSSVASSVSSDGGGNSRSNEVIVPATIITKPSQQPPPVSAQSSGSTGNVWQQRMAARQEQIAKVVPETVPETRSTEVSVERESPMTRHTLLEKSGALTPHKREPQVSAVAPPDHSTIPDTVKLPEPIGRPTPLAAPQQQQQQLQLQQQQLQEQQRQQQLEHEEQQKQHLQQLQQQQQQQQMQLLQQQQQAAQLKHQQQQQQQIQQQLYQAALQQKQQQQVNQHQQQINQLIQASYPTSQLPQQQSSGSFSRAPGTRPTNQESFSRAPGPPSQNRTELFVEQPVAFGQFLPQNTSSGVPSSLSSTIGINQTLSQIKTPEPPKVSDADLNFDFTSLKLFDDSKVSEIWGKPDKNVSNSEEANIWGPNLFTSFLQSAAPLPPSDNTASDWGSGNQFMTELVHRPSSTTIPSVQPTSANPIMTANATIPTTTGSTLDMNGWNSQSLGMPNQQSLLSQQVNRDSTKSVPLFARSQSQSQGNVNQQQSIGNMNDQLSALQQQVSQTRHLALMRQQHATIQQQQQNLLNQLQSSINEQQASASNLYSQLAAQLLTHQETNNGTIPQNQQSGINPNNYYQSPSYTDASILSQLGMSNNRLNNFSGFATDPQEEIILNAFIEKQKMTSGSGSTNLMHQKPQPFLPNAAPMQNVSQRSGLQARQPQPFNAPAPPPGFAALGAQSQSASSRPNPQYYQQPPQQQPQQQQQPPSNSIFNQFPGQTWSNSINPQQPGQQNKTPNQWGNWN